MFLFKLSVFDYDIDKSCIGRSILTLCELKFSLYSYFMNMIRVFKGRVFDVVLWVVFFSLYGNDYSFFKLCRKEESVELKDKNEMKGEVVKSVEKSEIIITKGSSDFEVLEFLKSKLSTVSEEAIRNLALDGESLLLLTDEDVDGIEDFSQEQKDTFKQVLKEVKTLKNGE